MNTVSLAELVRRGMNSEAGLPCGMAARSPSVLRGDAEALVSDPEVQRIIASSDMFIQRLTAPPADAASDSLVLRRHILSCVERFISDLTSQR